MNKSLLAATRNKKGDDLIYAMRLLDFHTCLFIPWTGACLPASKWSYVLCTSVREVTVIDQLNDDSSIVNASVGKSKLSWKGADVVTSSQTSDINRVTFTTSVSGTFCEWSECPAKNNYTLSDKLNKNVQDVRKNSVEKWLPLAFLWDFKRNLEEGS